MTRPWKNVAGDPISMAMPATQATSQVFERLAEPFRRELKLHCYRMLGSVHEAEDLVQETYLRAWRSFDRFEGRGSLRSWLYRIATNACLDALAKAKDAHRLLPDQRGPATTRMPQGTPVTELAWLEPYPDLNLQGIVDEAQNPEARYAARQAVQLAFVALIQQLPPRQRAALLLCDVLGWSAIEAAALLGTSTAAINSALQRARETLAKRYPDGVPSRSAAPDAAERTLLARYLRAWEGRDLDGFVALLKEDATYTMPPLHEWYAGRAAIRSFYATVWKTYGGFRLLPAGANGQPAFAAYSRSGADGPWAAHSIHVLDLEHDMISALTLFVKPASPRLFDAFGLPQTLNESEAQASAVGSPVSVPVRREPHP
jgi:RNA polymerase sigma-70 factor (ECF subfamily)